MRSVVCAQRRPGRHDEKRGRGRETQALHRMFSPHGIRSRGESSPPAVSTVSTPALPCLSAVPKCVESRAKACGNAALVGRTGRRRQLVGAVTGGRVRTADELGQFGLGSARRQTGSGYGTGSPAVDATRWAVRRAG